VNCQEPSREALLETLRLTLHEALEATRAFAIYLLSPPPVEKLRGERWNTDGEIIRGYRETPTPVGNLPEQIDYADYRPVGIIRLLYRA
jgi:hypothetical protein